MSLKDEMEKIIKEDSIGRKFDNNKAPVRQGLLEYFPRACIAVATLSAWGAEKYDWGNWQFVEDAINRYGNAECRHICEAKITGEEDLESGLLHAVHEAWNAMAVLEKKLQQKEQIDE